MISNREQRIIPITSIKGGLYINTPPLQEKEKEKC
jgi:hypothetical protein